MSSFLYSNSSDNVPESLRSHDARWWCRSLRKYYTTRSTPKPNCYPIERLHRPVRLVERVRYEFNPCRQSNRICSGAQYGGVSSRSQCDQLPAVVREGCYWRFDWFKGSDNPDVSWKLVKCPKKLVDISGCGRTDNPPLTS
jgi:hypothetical protein